MTTKALNKKPESCRFRAWLFKNRITPETFSRKTDIHFSTVMKWYGGQSSPLEVFKEKIKKSFADCPLVK